jgi:hypothetical protein
MGARRWRFGRRCCRLGEFLDGGFEEYRREEKRKGDADCSVVRIVGCLPDLRRSGRRIGC